MNKFPVGIVGYCKDEEKREKSTSGGICQVFTEHVLSCGGAVSAVEFSDDYKDVIRTIAHTIEETQGYKGSKYIQARQGDTYRQIKELLKEGTAVLFIGTPCQVAGLLSFLGCRPKGLICIDFICLGVPSAKIWQAYCKDVSKSRRITEVSFKSKKNGWRNFTFRMEFSDGSKIEEPGRTNVYMQPMIEKTFSRPSCYHCPFRSISRKADITVADAWGAEEIAPELLDDKGTSSIMINTEQGMELFENIQGQLKWKKVDVNLLWKTQRSAWDTYEMPKYRKKFFDSLNRGSYSDAIRRIKLQKKLQGIIGKMRGTMRNDGSDRSG